MSNTTVLWSSRTISELVRPKPDPRVIDWMEAAAEGLLYLNVPRRIMAIPNAKPADSDHQPEWRYLPLERPPVLH